MASNTRATLPGTASPFHQLLMSQEVRHLVVIRVSEQSLAALSSQTELGKRLNSAVPAIQRLADLPSGILSDNADGDALRRAHGVVPVYRRDASPYAQSPGAVMGFAVPAGADGVVLFIHDSAAQANVLVPDDTLPRVAYSELILGIFKNVPSLEQAYFNDWKRMVRNELEGHKLFESARLHGVGLTVADKEVDLVSTGGRVVASIEGGQASGERDGIRRRTTGGVLNALHSGGDGEPPAWPYAEELRPLGWDFVRDADGRVRTRAGGRDGRWRLIAPAIDEIAAVRDMLVLVGEGRPWRVCAEPLVRDRVACRGSDYAGKSYADMPSEARGRSVANLVREHLAKWETGRYQKVKNVPTPHDGTFEGFPVTPRHGSYGEIEIDIDLGLPEGGFLSPETADLIRERLAKRETKDGVGATTTSLLSYLKPYRDKEGGDDFTWERRLVRQGDCYILRQRLASAAVDARGRARGWKADDGTVLLTVRRTDLEASIAAAVAEAVRHVGDQKLAVTVRHPRRDDEVGRLSEQICELEAKVENVRAEAAAADKLASLAVSGEAPNHAAATRHMASATAHYAEAERLSARLDDVWRARQTAEADQSENEIADLSTAAAVAGCLIGYAGNEVPLEVNQALRGVGFDTLCLDVDPSNSRRVCWTLSLDLPLEGGGLAQISIGGTVRNRRRDQDANTTRHELDAAIAEGFLRQGLSLESLGRSFGKNRAAVVTSLRDYLSRNGIRRRGLRSAIVDLPVEMTETRLALWGVVSDDLDSSAHLASLREHLGHVYCGDLDHPNAWVRTDTTLVRKALRVMADAQAGPGCDGVSIDALARTIGASRTQINTLCGDRAATGSTAARFRGVLVRDTTNPDLVRMRACPHDNCSAAKGSRWLSHYLPVPETDGYHGLICPSCHRLPDSQLADLYLPASYLDHFWDGPANAANFDLKIGSATREREPAAYQPSSRLPRRSRVYSISEAASHLGITDAAVRRWIKDEEDPLACRRLSGRGGLKYGIAEETLQWARTHPRLQELRQRSPRPDGVGSDFITLRELSKRTGVAEHFLRDRAVAGGMGAYEHKNLTGKGQAHLVVSRTVLNADAPKAGTALLPAEWIDRHQEGLLLIGDAAARAGQTPSVIRDAVRTGQLRSFLTDGGTHRFAEPDVDAWAAERRQKGLTPKAAAERTGVNTEMLRAAAARGDLQATKTVGGHRRYPIASLDAWCEAQAQATP